MAELPAVVEAMDAIVTGNEVAKPKPAPDLFIEVARRLRVDPTRCLAFDDSAPGVLGAQAAGMLTAAVGPAVGARFAALAPDWRLRDIGSFDVREIVVPKVAAATANAEPTGMAALLRLLPEGSPLQKCLAGNPNGSGGYGV